MRKKIHGIALQQLKKSRGCPKTYPDQKSRDAKSRSKEGKSIDDAPKFIDGLKPSADASNPGDALYSVAEAPTGAFCCLD